MGYRVEIDKSSCQSSGNCVEAEPEGFGWDEDDLGDALPGASRLPLERLVAAARHCPALAIAIYDEGGRQIESED
jgi:ferredoxin